MLQRIRRVPLLVAASLFFVACETDRTADRAPAAAGTADVQAEEQRIRELSQQWTEAARGRNADQMANLYAEDAVMYEPGQQPLRGRNAIRDHYAQWMQLDIRELESNPSEIEVAASGDLAYEVGEFRFAAETPQGRVSDQGPYLAVWRKRNGQWQIVQEISNSSVPAAQAAQPTT